TWIAHGVERILVRRVGTRHSIRIGQGRRPNARLRGDSRTTNCQRRVGGGSGGSGDGILDCFNNHVGAGISSVEGSAVVAIVAVDHGVGGDQHDGSNAGSAEQGQQKQRVDQCSSAFGNYWCDRRFARYFVSVFHGFAS